MNDNDIRKLAARRTIYSLPGNPSPWPRRLRRIVYVLLIFAAAALLYTFAAEASGNPPPRPHLHHRHALCVAPPLALSRWQMAFGALDHRAFPTSSNLH